MSQLIDYDFWGSGFFTSVTSNVSNINYTEAKNAIFDEMDVRERTDIDISNIHEEWQIDTRLQWLCDSIEAGNVQNSGMKIEKFAIKRRHIDELTPVTLGYRDFINNDTVEFSDYTQPNDSNLVYSIVPISDQLEGIPNEINVNSEFVGWWIVDKETNEVLGFDQFLDSSPTVETQLNQSKVQIDTLTKFPRFIYTSQSYHTFSLTATFLPEENERIGKKYEDILDKFIYSHKPFLIKSDTGCVYICDISNPKKSTPLNTWNGYEYMTFTIDCVEVADYLSYMNDEV
jgi:hypothetical protein